MAVLRYLVNNVTYALCFDAADLAVVVVVQCRVQALQQLHLAHSWKAKLTSERLLRSSYLKDFRYLQNKLNKTSNTIAVYETRKIHKETSLLSYISTDTRHVRDV